jgi:hypothetical protein
MATGERHKHKTVWGRLAFPLGFTTLVMAFIILFVF